MSPKDDGYDRDWHIFLVVKQCKQKSVCWGAHQVSKDSAKPLATEMSWVRLSKWNEMKH